MVRFATVKFERIQTTKNTKLKLTKSNISDSNQCFENTDHKEIGCRLLYSFNPDRINELIIQEFKINMSATTINKNVLHYFTHSRGWHRNTDCGM